jgi:A/G-specific adenine glycosylase
MTDRSRLKRFTRTECRKAQESLLTWFESAKRILPWRLHRNPYSTWVSEVMLQQTQAATVIPYFERWMKTYPSVSTLAKARESDVLRLWEGLGYYSRARHLLRGAQLMIEQHRGQVPSDVATLRSIPGIGRYTAGAIASIAYQQAQPVLDGNVMRVLCRWRDIPGDSRRAPLHEHLWTLARQLATDTNAALVNESLMELGAVLCTPTKPRCSECPLRRRCRALANGHVQLRPTPARRPKATLRTVTIAVVSKRDQLLLKQQEVHAKQWASLWTFPHWEGLHPDDIEQSVADWLNEALGLMVASATVFARGSYAITRFRFHYVAVQALFRKLAMSRLPAGYAWVARQQLDTLAMPASHRRLIQKL